MKPVESTSNCQECHPPVDTQATRLAIPTGGMGGLAAVASPHFGKSPWFTIVDVQDGQPQRVSMMENPPHGDCQDPVSQLAAASVDIVLVRGIGMRPLTACRKLGIPVYVGEAKTVGEMVAAYRSGRLSAMDDRNTCGCGGNH